jgi:sugar phosphate isomerase/epimerase
MRTYVFSGFADEYSPSLDEQIAGLRELGIRHLELRFADTINVSDFTVAKTAEVKAKLDAAGISVSAIGSPIGKIRLDEDFQAHLELARRTFWIANQLGCSYIRMFSFYPPKGKNVRDCRDEVISRLRALLDLADEYGVTLCHENEAKIYGEAPEMCLDLLQHFEGRLRCVFDMGNFRLEKYDPMAAYEMLKDYIAYFHIKDGTADHVILPPGEGEAQIEAILRAHRENGCGECVVSLEPHLHAFVGLASLTGEQLNQSYRYESSAAAYSDAARRLGKILESLA